MLSPIEDSPCDLSGIAVHQQGPLTFLVKEVEDLKILLRKLQPSHFAKEKFKYLTF